MDSIIVSWNSMKFYVYPPFSVISRIMKRIKAEKAEGIYYCYILLVHYWLNQAQFPVLFQMLTDTLILITSGKIFLKLPQNLVQPKWRKKDMVVCLQSASSSQKAMEFQNKLKRCWKEMFETDKVTIFILGLLKKLRPGHHLEPMVLLRYPDQQIWVVSYLEQYIEKSKDLRRGHNLFITFVKPQKRIITSTISLWCVAVLNGVEVTDFESHSTRSSSHHIAKGRGFL